MYFLFKDETYNGRLVVTNEDEFFFVGRYQMLKHRLKEQFVFTDFQDKLWLKNGIHVWEPYEKKRLSTDYTGFALRPDEL